MKRLFQLFSIFAFQFFKSVKGFTTPLCHRELQLNEIVISNEMQPIRKFGLFALISSVTFLYGCAGGPALNPPSGTIGGISAPKSKVVLSRQQEAKQGINVTYVLPAGDYRAAFEDETGIYYEAPSKVIMKENFLGMNLPGKPFTGGIFLERANPKVAKIYSIAPENEGGEIHRMLKGGRPGKPIIPRQPIQFQLTRS